MVYILIIEAVAKKVNIVILFMHITESNRLFAEINVIEQLHFTEGVQTIHLGHLCFDSTIGLGTIDCSKVRGGTLGISGWGCAARTLEPLAYTRANFSWILLPYTRVNSLNHS